MKELAQAMIDPVSLVGGYVASVPVVGQELIVRVSERFINVGQVLSVEYEDGSGKGFNIRATRIKQEFRPAGDYNWPRSVYVKLANPSLAIPIQYG